MNNLSPQFAFPSGFLKMDIASLYQYSKNIQCANMARVDKTELETLRKTVNLYKTSRGINRVKMGAIKVSDILTKVILKRP